MPNGYNGSSAGPPGTGRFGDGSDGNGGNNSDKGPTGPTLLTMMEENGPQKPLTDEQVSKIMNEDPAAMLFLEGMLPGAKGAAQNRNEDDD